MLVHEEDASSHVAISETPQRGDIEHILSSPRNYPKDSRVAHLHLVQLVPRMSKWKLVSVMRPVKFCRCASHCIVHLNSLECLMSFDLIPQRIEVVQVSWLQEKA